ncbi:MAG: hypothetical protein PHX43_09695 [Alphaproteobacteria bacterium]|nr:hypothetical protein [Alphaproteobacteria bacterium]
MAKYISPADVISPKTSWRLIDVIIDRGEGDCAYALGMWEKRRCVGFRWNGNKERPLGNPQSRGLPTWTVLDRKLHKAILELVKKENHIKAPIVQAFFAQQVEQDDE